MATRLYRASVFALYQFSIALGITLLPVAIVANRAGVPIPVGRLVERLGEAHERLEETDADGESTA
jgi:chloramphenicol O-acetyltransferase